MSASQTIPEVIAGLESERARMISEPYSDPLRLDLIDNLLNALEEERCVNAGITYVPQFRFREKPSHAKLNALGKAVRKALGEESQ